MKLKKFALAMILAVAAGSVTTINASPVGGTKVTSTGVAAFRTDRFVPTTFYAGERASVGVRGDGSTTLRLRVYDANGHYIDGDTCTASVCVATWTPKWTGSFYITVENTGAYYNNYTMVAE